MFLNDPQRVYRALKVYGVPLKGIAALDFQDPTMILQIGGAPVRIDILGLKELIQAKQAAGRPQDKLDLAKLRKRRDER